MRALLRSEFVANISKLLAGKSVVFLITFAAIPIISRLYDPADYGVAGIFAAVSSIALIFFTLKYEPSVILPDSMDTARELSNGVVKLALIATVVMALLIAPARYFFIEHEIVQRLGQYIWLLPVVTLLAAIAKVFDAWVSRQKKFSRIATGDVGMALTNTGTRIGSGLLFGSSVVGLLAGLALGYLIKILMLFPLGRDAIVGFKANHFHERAALLSYSEFPRFNMPADFIRTFVQNLPLLLFGIMYSAAIAGLFFMAYRLSKVPLDMALGSFRKVYLQKISEIKNQRGNLQIAYKKSVLGMAMIGVIPALVLAFFGQELSTVLLGQKWSDAGRYVEVLSPLLWSAWVASPAAMFLVVLRKQNIWLWMQLINAVLQITMFTYAFATRQTVMWTLAAFVLIQFAINLVLNFAVLRINGRPDSSMVGQNSDR